MLKKIILYCFIYGALYSQVILHQPEESTFSDAPLYIEVFSDFNYSEIASFDIFYRSNNEDIYIKDRLTYLSNNDFSYTIKPNFLNGQYIEYYFLIEMKDDSYYTFPKSDPHNNPISVRIDNTMQTEFIHKSYLDADCTILSPLPNENVKNDELVVSLSYFRMKDLDLSSTRVFIDNKDMSLSASIRQNNLILIPPVLLNGEHKIEVFLTGNNGLEYNPVSWVFNIIDGEDVERKLTFNGRVWNDYTGSEIDNNNLFSNTTNLHFNLYYDWIDVKAKIKKSSQENKFDQAKDRYSFDINLNDLFKIKIGDFYPEFNQFMLKGNRVRGLGVKLKTDKFRFNIINGELARATQGNPFEGAVTISDFSSDYVCTKSETNDNGTWWDAENSKCMNRTTWDDEYDNGDGTFGACLDGIGELTEQDETTCNSEDILFEIYLTESECESDDTEDCTASYDPYYVDVSRGDYTFKRDLKGLRIEVGDKNRMNFGFSILKAEDDISSVDSQVLNAMVSLPDNVEALQTFNSDQFIDFDGKGLAITIDYNNDGICDGCDGTSLSLPDNVTGTLELVETIIECDDIVVDGYLSQDDFNELCESLSPSDDICDGTEGGNWSCFDTEASYTIIQYVWDAQISYPNLNDLLTDVDYYQILDNSNQECDDIQDEEICSATSYCEWDDASSSCRNISCMDFADQVECTENDLVCSWESNDEGDYECVNLILDHAQSIQDINVLSDQWGAAPKDNLVIGSDFSFTSKNQRTKVKTSFAMSLYNDNTWNDGITMTQLDGSLDGYEDCYIGRTYDFSQGFSLTTIEDPNNPGEFLDVTECIEFSCENDELSLSTKISESCQGIDGIIDLAIQATDVDTVEGLLNKIKYRYDEYILESGTLITDIPNIEEYSDDFLFTLDNLPLPKLINKFIDGRDSDIKLYDIFNSPDVAYDIDFVIRADKHHFNFGYKQVGESFYSLANPYIQTNTRERYFTDRMRLLNNRLFFILKYNNMISGFVSDNQSITNKYDLNFSYYPGINLPSFNMNIGMYNRKSGEQDFGYVDEDGGTTWVNGQCIYSDGGTTWNSEYDNEDGTFGACLDSDGIPTGADENTCYEDDSEYTAFADPDACASDDDQIIGAYDNRIKTSTKNYNFSITHSIDFIYKHDLVFNYFTSEKDDKLFYERVIDEDYVSPKSSNSNFNINVKTTYDYRWSSSFQYSTSNFDYGQVSSLYYQKQKINSFSGGFIFKTDALIDKIGATLNFARGVGSNKYNQTGIKLFAKLAFRENLDLNLNYNYKKKKITDLSNTEDPTQNYYNSSFKANLTYRF